MLVTYRKLERRRQWTTSPRTRRARHYDAADRARFDGWATEVGLPRAYWWCMAAGLGRARSHREFGPGWAGPMVATVRGPRVLRVPPPARPQPDRGMGAVVLMLLVLVGTDDPRDRGPPGPDGPGAPRCSVPCSSAQHRAGRTQEISSATRGAVQRMTPPLFNELSTPALGAGWSRRSAAGAGLSFRVLEEQLEPLRLRPCPSSFRHCWRRPDTSPPSGRPRAAGGRAQLTAHGRQAGAGRVGGFSGTRGRRSRRAPSDR